MMKMMDTHAADTVTMAAAKGLGVAKILLRSCHSGSNLFVTDSYSQQSSSSSPSAGVLPIAAVILPVDAIAPPPVKSATYRLPRRTLLRRKRRTKRKLSADGSGGAGDEGFFFGDGGDGPYGGGFGGRGGGWNFNRFGDGDDWDESSSSLPDPAFDFVYQVLSWIMLWNCLHFAFKKIVRIIADGILDADREKVPRRMAPIC